MTDSAESAAEGTASPTDDDRALLRVADVRGGYGETEVLTGVSLEVREGEVVALVGRNGVGKTTTLRAVLGAVRPTAGTVAFRGENVTDLSPVETVRRGVGVVPEERRVFPGLTVEENLTIGRYGGGETATRHNVDEVLAMFENLRERRRSRGADLSGGEQQMLAIGRALVAGADLLMLDEPTEGLAPLVVRRVADLVRDLNADGTAMLLVEQNVAVALDLADRVYVLDRGRVVHEATPAELEADQSVLDRYLGVTT